MNYKKPQMTVDERRYIPVTYFVKKTHRKGRKERKAMQQESLRPLCSLWFITSSTLAHGRAPPQPAPAVYSRLSRGGMSMEGDFGGGDELIVSSKLIINYRQTVSAESSRFHYIRLMDLRENIVEAF